MAATSYVGLRPRGQHGTILYPEPVGPLPGVKAPDGTIWVNVSPRRWLPTRVPYPQFRATP